jgi:hypothetical protein
MTRGAGSWLRLGRIVVGMDNRYSLASSFQLIAASRIHPDNRYLFLIGETDDASQDPVARTAKLTARS